MDFGARLALRRYRCCVETTPTTQGQRKGPISVLLFMCQTRCS